MWKDIFDVEIIWNHNQFIHLRVSHNNHLVSWITDIYGSPISSIRKSLWSALELLASSVQGPWLLGGDFNTILHDSEKKGGSPNGLGACRLYQAWFHSQGMYDLHFHGPQFMWSRGTLFKRLVRVSCNNYWVQRFADYTVLHLPKLSLDHRLILVKCENCSSNVSHDRPFRFQVVWLTNNKFS